MDTTVTENPQKSTCEWVTRIAAALQKGNPTVFEVGRLLQEAKDSLDHGKFIEMVETELPIGPRLVQMYMKIAKDSRLQTRNIISYLPGSVSVLHELTKLSDARLAEKIGDGTIRPTMRLRDLTPIAKKAGGVQGATTGEVLNSETLEIIGEKAKSAGSNLVALKAEPEQITIWGECAPLVATVGALAKAIESGGEKLANLFAGEMAKADPQMRGAVELHLRRCAEFLRSVLGSTEPTVVAAGGGAGLRQR